MDGHRSGGSLGDKSERAALINAGKITCGVPLARLKDAVKFCRLCRIGWITKISFDDAGRWINRQRQTIRGAGEDNLIGCRCHGLVGNSIGQTASGKYHLSTRQDQERLVRRVIETTSNGRFLICEAGTIAGRFARIRGVNPACIRWRGNNGAVGAVGEVIPTP